MFRRAHVLKSNKRTSLPTHYFFYDSETQYEEITEDTQRHTLKLGWVCYHREPTTTSPGKDEWLEFHSCTEFWDFIESHIYPHTRVLLIAHNQHFDFLVVDGFRSLAERGWDMTKAILDTDIFIVTFRRGTRSILVLDNTNYFKQPLASLGEYIGLPKGKVDFAEVGPAELSLYCHRDVEILMKVFMAWIQWIDEHDLGCLQPTAAGQAFGAYRHRFMPYKIYVHTNQYATDLERESYRGGRNECLRIGHISGSVYDLDFNSLYPYVMRRQEYPCKLIMVHPEGSTSALRHLLQGYAVIARCKVNLDRPCIGLSREKLIFPVGSFWVTLCTPEIQYLLQHEVITDVGPIAVYEQALLFKEYVEWCYEQRRVYKARDNRIGDLLTKLMMNSLYGKFGQRARKTEILGECPPDAFYVERCIDAQTGECYLVQYFGGKCRRVISTREESYNSFAAVASHVTAYARMILWATMQKAGLEHVYYVDTDSLFVDRTGYERLQSYLNPTELGYLKLVAEFKSMFIHGCKDYECDGKPKLKGVKANATRVDTHDYRQERFNRFSSMLHRGKAGAVDIDMVTKHLTRTYDKGHVMSDGSVLPLTLP